jgi:O-antigen ligase
MNIIPKELAGVLTIAGLVLILALNLIFSQPIGLSLMLTGVLLLTTVFLYNPGWGVFLFLFIRPTLDSFGDSAQVRLTEHISLNASAGLGLLMIFLAAVFFVKNFQYIKQIPLKFFWFFYLTVIAISIFFSIEKLISFYELLRLISIFSVFGMAFAITRIQKSPRFIFYAVLSSAVIPALSGFYQFLTGSGISRTLGIESRIYGTFSHPNSFASFLLIIFAVCLFYFLYHKEKSAENNNKKNFFAIGVSFIFILLIATFSRGAWLALLIFGFILSIFKNPKILLYVGAALLATILIFEPVRDRVEDLYNPPITGSVYWRMQQWSEMYTLFKENPLTGYGAGTETIVHEQEFGFYAGNPYTHNDLLKNALEAGIFGALAYAALLLAAALKLFKGYLKESSKTKKVLLLIVLSLFIAESAFGMSSNILRGTAAQWTLWAIIGATLATMKIKKPGKLS